MPLVSYLEDVSVRRQGAKPDRERERDLRECRCLHAEFWCRVRCFLLILEAPAVTRRTWQKLARCWLTCSKSDLDTGHICEMNGWNTEYVFSRNETVPKFQADLQELEGNRKPWNLGWIFNDFHGVSINFRLDLALARFWSYHFAISIAILSSFLRSSKTKEIVATLGWVEKLPIHRESRLILTAGTYTIALTNTPRIGSWVHVFITFHMCLSFFHIFPFVFQLALSQPPRKTWPTRLERAWHSQVEVCTVEGHQDQTSWRTSDIQLHPDGEFDIEITLTLEEEEEILGFQFNEAWNWSGADIT